jgi:hypothetical protein
MYAVAILSLVFDVSVSESVKRDHLNQLIKENEAKKPTTAIHGAIAKNPFEPITKPPKLPRTRTQRKDSPSSSSSSSSSEASDDDNYSMHDDESKLHQHLFHQRATVILNCQQLLLLLLLQDRCRGFSIVGHCEPLANLRMPWTWHWRCLML